jgi:hypothetical protein
MDFSRFSAKIRAFSDFAGHTAQAALLFPPMARFVLHACS